MRGEEPRDVADQRGFEQRLVALDVDDDGRVGQSELLRGLGQAVGAGRMIGARDAGDEAVRAHRGGDPVVVGGDDDALCACRLRALRDADDHRDAPDLLQRLAREAGRRVAGGDQDGEAGRAHSYSAGSRRRASSSSITGMPSRMG